MSCGRLSWPPDAWSARFDAAHKGDSAIFVQPLSELEAALPEPELTLAQVSETIWALRQQFTAGVAQTIVEHTHQQEQRRKSLRCGPST